MVEVVHNGEKTAPIDHFSPILIAHCKLYAHEPLFPPLIDPFLSLNRRGKMLCFFL